MQKLEVDCILLIFDAYDKDPAGQNPQEISQKMALYAYF